MEPCTADVMQKNHMWLAHLCRVSPDECRAPGSLIKAGRSAGGAGCAAGGVGDGLGHQHGLGDSETLLQRRQRERSGPAHASAGWPGFPSVRRLL